MVGTGRGWEPYFSKWLVGVINEKGESRGYCPIHEDPALSKSPSGSFNFLKGAFFCQSSCGGMSFSNLRKSIVEESQTEVPAPPGLAGFSEDDIPHDRAFGVVEREIVKPLPTDAQLQKFTEALLASKQHCQVMMGDRGLSDATIIKFEIGWDGGRYTIPVRDRKGRLRNVRRYKPGLLDGGKKMFSWGQGWGERRLFLPQVLEQYEEVVLVEGEMDAIIGQQYGLPTLTHTGGAGNWNPEWSLLFEDKIVFICYDRDKAGEEGSFKVGHALSQIAKEVYKIELPGNTPGFDLTDYFVKQNYTERDFRDLMRKSHNNPIGQLKRNLSLEKPIVVSLEGSMKDEVESKPIEIVTQVTGKGQPAYILPREVSLTCDAGFGMKCKKCPVSIDQQFTFSIDNHDPIILEMIDNTTDSSKKKILKRIGAPTACPRVDFENLKMWAVEELFVATSPDERVDESNIVNRTVYNVGPHDTKTNIVVKLIGSNRPHPKTGKGVLQAWSCTPTQTELDTFTVTPSMIEALKVFRVAKRQTPVAKMTEIVRDLASNITNIYGRDPLHLAYDLVWHSALNFDFLGHSIGKGWLELLVVGDTRTGKSLAAQKLIQHYSAGLLKSCEGTTFAGLVGGATQPTGKGWTINWGAIPLNDRRLVVLDEFSGMTGKNVIEQMSSLRSSGRAQITKIESQETHARTRLIWVSNPIDGRAMNEHEGGAIEAIRGLIHNPEDIARFDFAISVSEEEVDSGIINSTEHVQVSHKYTQELCSILVAWVWSRKADQILWDPGVEQLLLEYSKRLGSSYVPDPPLIQVASVKEKLARLSVAVAARVFSSTKDGKCIRVKMCHVDASVELLNMFYGVHSFGYADHSKRILRNKELANSNRRQAYTYLATEEKVRRTLRSVSGGDFKLRDFVEFQAMELSDAQQAVVKLQEWKMIETKSRGYMRKTAALLQVMDRLAEDLEES